MKTKEIIKKWYDILKFPEKYNEEFEKALNEIEIPDNTSIEAYNLDETDGRKNLLSYLYMCEELERRYEEKGIDKKILYDTIYDIVIWTKIWSGIKNELCLSELAWLKNHMSLKLVKLGRLEFAFDEAICDIPEKDIKKGDNIIAVHIPETGPLYYDACTEAINYAKSFLTEFFPEYKYKAFTCHSWLLDEALQKLMKPESNILKFQTLFNPVHSEESYAILRYIFKWDTSRDNLADAVPTSSFAEKLKASVLSGNKFYEVTGYIK